jgi:hypothetical protein
VQAQIIPLEPSIAEYDFTVPIQGATYRFDVRWNEAAAAWYFDLTDPAGALVVAGVKIVLGTLLGKSSGHELFARGGVFLAYDTTKTDTEATFDDIGRRVLLLFVPMDVFAFKKNLAT